ncbi:MAG: proton-conducting transporter membrane subunit, partial [Vicinamibacterales bacterium]
MSPDALGVAIVLSPFALLPIFGWLGARGRRSASLLAVFPAVLTAYFVHALARIGETGAFSAAVPWGGSLGLSLAFRFDGLGVLFATLITGVGTMIVVYAARYLDGHPEAGRFQAMLCAFMGAMLGVALSDNVLLLFVFWELTGFTSYLLIGFDHDRREARAAALQALIVTGAGGLALLAAAVVITQITGVTTISAMAAGGADLRRAPAYPGIVCLVLLAAFTKSAQFPFHFWLPNAMEAPTPVSAYLHSATMVKAGVYLVARFTPLLGGTTLWTGALVLAGSVTTIGAAWRAVLETDLKRVLAYSTVSALGMLMLLLGIGSRAAIAASLVYLLAHACYKGALFLVAGAIEHETGTRDVTALSGLHRVMPRTALAALLAGCSMAGLPLFFGFIAKEQLYEAVAGAAISGIPPAVLMVAAVGASALLGAAGLLAGVAPFTGRVSPATGVHEAPAPLWMSPLTLAIAG